MKKLFLLPFLVFVMLFTSCEKAELFDGFIEPCCEFGASPNKVKQYMAKHKIDLLDDDGDWLKFGNYGDCKYFYYEFEDGKMNMSSVDVKTKVFKRTLEQIEKKYVLAKTIGPNEGVEMRYYINKEKTIVLRIYVPTDFDVLLNYETFDIVYISIDFPGVKDILGW